MTLFESIILGLVQGLAEFLPISSSGHLAALQYIFGIDGSNVLTFTVMLHFGTLVAIFVVYWKDIVDLVKELFATIKDICTGQGVQVNKNDTRKLGFMIITASVPTAIIGLLLNDFFESLYARMTVIGVCLIITGCGLFFAERYGGGKRTIKDMNFRNAFFIGLCQSVAIMPGISRSGATMIGGLACKFDRAFAVRYAFLISIPSVLGAFLLEVPDAVRSVSDGTGMSLGVMLAGVAVAAVSGYAAIKVMIKAVTNKKLMYFSVYTWIAGAALIIYSIAA
ncbi:MAG: undecaprenyl-diphosphate phosphatase [Anaerovoracaceae bacterium]|nr:undecaprenyl-diphosphate phosphatase [Bacillota bacterium]MDD7734158.1 undecaprenyl-diphosphate phosphatase [Bacillota bacterium]MDY5905690.1 undecaprenyl-diphosphate phosphatase [Anaerovoracaceae bacterium]